MPGLAPLLQIQLSAHVPGTQQMIGQVVVFLPLRWETQVDFLDHGFSLAHPWMRQEWSVDGRSISLLLSSSLSASNKHTHTQINDEGTN